MLHRAHDDTEETEQAFRDSARDFLQKISPLSRLRDMRNTDPGYDRKVWGKMADMGWTGLLVPEANGGLGLGLRAASVVAQEIGRRPLPEPYTASAVQAVSLLQVLPESALANELLAGIAQGDLIAGFAWQESPGAANSPLETRAVAQEGAIQLNGTKYWVYPASGADGWLVTCRLGNEDALYWLPAATNGVSVQTTPRVDGSLAATLILSGASVPAACLLAQGAAVGRAADHAHSCTRVIQASELLGISRQTFEITLDYLKTRVQFGKPIGANQALQHRMVDAYLQIELATAALAECLSQDENGVSALAALSARAKARCAQAALHMTRLAIQFHGAIGYTDELDVGLYLKRALHLCSWLGGVNENRQLAYTPDLERDSSPEHDAEADDVQINDEIAGNGDWNALTEDAFRRLVRQFIQAHYPVDLRNPAGRLHWHEVKEWYLALSRKGWLAPAWPREYGGMALEPDKLIAFIEEMEAYGVARTPDQGIINIGPVLIKYGTQAQREKYLPKILSGEHVWCQGYSEPNAGSDLASLRTAALIDGEEFVVTGQKIWTTLAQDATHIFVLVRTDKTVKNQAGISFLLAELGTPGITVKPIRNIGGEEEFCEVFFDQARIPRENLVGQLNQGWTIAKALLDFERIFVGSPSQAKYVLNQLRRLAEHRALFDDAAFRSRYVCLALDVADLQALYTGYADIVKRGDALPPSVSLLKIWATETYSRIAMELVEAAQESGGDMTPIEIGDTCITPASRLFNSAITTIYGGTNEIQRNILAKLVLGLPV